MRKKINIQFLIKVAAYLRYLPVIIFKIKNWRVFVLNYLGVKDQKEVYQFRDGTKIKTSDGVSAATIAVIFIKKDYGATPENSVIIDIGANIGVYSIFACKSKNTKVYAFEPALQNYNLLVENIKLNGLGDRIIPFKAAVGAKKEKRTIYIGDSPFNSFHSIDNPYGQEEVECVSLRDVFDENKIQMCDILKMDCEGAEFEILYNLPDEYYKKIKEIRAEYHSSLSDQKDNPEDLLKFLEQKGFKITKIKKVNSSNGDFWAKKI